MLLDTHALYWLVGGAVPLSDAALIAVGEAQEAGALFVSPISAWEISLAAAKPSHRDPPDLGAASPARWFREALIVTTAKLAPIRQRIAIEAADVASLAGHRDPGDCYLVATARVRKLTLVTRDAALIAIAGSRPGYLDILAC